MREAALRLGFDAVGFARADVPLEADHAAYERYLARGLHGDMKYLAENRAVRRRLDTPDVLEGARTIIVVASRYGGDGADRGLAPRIARYARGRDYHNKLRKRLRQLAVFVRALAEGVTARPMTDTAPVLEKAWAARAGVGFVGKNGLVIVPGIGSYVLLGEVVTSLALKPDEPMESRCGACTRCLDGCPTRAFDAPHVLDPRRCISYLTIEHRSEVAPELRAGMSGWVFGCDVCQEVCPFNGARGAVAEAKETYRALPVWSEGSLAAALEWDEETFREKTRGTAVVRATHEGFLRSVAIEAGNARDARCSAALRGLMEHGSPAVRDAARWALSRIAEG